MDSNSPPGGPLNGLACLACKSRKTRCDRSKPTCDGCFARRQPCIYPKRKARKKANSAARRSTPQYVEDKCSKLVASSSQVKVSPLVADSDSETSPFSLLGASPTAKVADDAPGEEAGGIVGSSLENPYSADTLLTEALAQVVHLKHQRSSIRSSYNENHVPPDIAKACLNNFCRHYMADIYQYSINTKLMYLIPHMINMPEVNIDPAALSLYHGMLYHGSLSVATRPDLQIENVTRVTYFHFVRAIAAWQKKFSGTRTDLVVAILYASLPLVDLVSENPEQAVSGLDSLVASRLTDLLLRFFDILSHYKRELNNDIIGCIQSLSEEIESLFREWPVIDTMTASENKPEHWWMLFDLTLIAYSSMITMCRELLHMPICLPTTPPGRGAIHQLVLSIARRMLNLAYAALVSYPVSTVVCYMFGAFRCDMAYGCMVEHLLAGDPGEPGSTAGPDITILWQVAQNVTSIAERDQDIMPLASTLYEMNQIIRAKWVLVSSGVTTRGNAGLQ
ncbi:uncharacterized protein VDAG_05292 [Verticillium dahliae VdLs.17]|uniref:Zn(2)-C6 fungal-type domain-containing protein n=2 Tax=Verticillium dahliae TaxID=27337 RepID=G2X5X6_VERDV|nr:uncharacterized protein VDAG_05292 [Verticillium dahliae VdLs.17]EGY14128.1 hypothetical protein VDAG_05292 [Verticillium dahliae VdLs.17]